MSCDWEERNNELDIPLSAYASFKSIKQMPIRPPAPTWIPITSTQTPSEGPQLFLDRPSLALETSNPHPPPLAEILHTPCSQQSYIHPSYMLNQSSITFIPIATVEASDYPSVQDYLRRFLSSFIIDENDPMIMVPPSTATITAGVFIQARFPQLYWEGQVRKRIHNFPTFAVYTVNNLGRENAPTEYLIVPKKFGWAHQTRLDLIKEGLSRPLQWWQSYRITPAHLEHEHDLSEGPHPIVVEALFR